ncbi:hypothetical protein GRF29_154g431173 [Pseudopithomyces chartarum]|uniref:Uncharacterized protein n=1 Tax=Pseudopithomyces chartarum TaxID=1892770 RepID=A0AAN6LQS8_9PLEO|nr:hypothetical protein GRF29_154g431173 [Pseudopithomyces chartarum]
MIHRRAFAAAREPLPPASIEPRGQPAPGQPASQLNGCWQGPLAGRKKPQSLQQQQQGKPKTLARAHSIYRLDYRLCTVYLSTIRCISRVLYPSPVAAASAAPACCISRCARAPKPQPPVRRPPYPIPGHCFTASRAPHVSHWPQPQRNDRPRR